MCCTAVFCKGFSTALNSRLVQQEELSSSSLHWTDKGLGFFRRAKKLDIVGEERRLRVFENRVLRRVFGLRRDEVTGE